MTAATGTRGYVTRRGGLLLAGLLAASTLAGCGGGSTKKASTAPDDAAAQLALLAAAASTFSSTAQTTTVTITGTPAQLGAALNAGRSKPLSDSQLSAIAGSRITYATAATNGKPLPSAGAGNSNSSVAVTTPSGPALQLRSLGPSGVLYVQSDTKALSSVLGHTVDTSSLQRLAQSGSLSFLGDALAGRWVGLKDLTQLSGLLSFGAAAASSAAAGATGSSLVQQFLTQALHDTTVKDTGTSGSVTHFTVSAQSGTIAKDLTATLLKIPGASLFQQRIAALEALVPNKPITFDATVTSGRLSELDLDLTQLATATSSSGKAVLTVKLSNTATAITAPAGATVVDASTLLTDASALLNLGTVLGGTGG